LPHLYALSIALYHLNSLQLVVFYYYAQAIQGPKQLVHCSK
jgi:hypothetical protein